MQFQVGQIHVLMHDGLVCLSDERRIILRVNLCIQVRLGMPKLAQDQTAVDVVEDLVIFIGDIWVSAVVKKNILQAFPMFRFWCNPNRGVLV